ncbi:uncharacterized protein FIBRA_03259 [Fibroporia radiculosa]|uniref:Uncharacterized protein n=1 Tax=Fibroporia radiculosa TaxID=599839 RepID=J4I9I3_9APHY|nr:uncharacterized protein FIBRA_03259 [Fibroporia radiculosa]CCM01211.1 predicted protein [Fibroporia radiculosa]
MPLTIAPDAMRRTVLERAGLDAHGPLPKPLDNLITRLSSFEMRTLYVRSLPMSSVASVRAHSTFDDYAVYALPHALFAYIREAAVLGLLTIVGSGRERWRTYVVGALAVTAVLECYWISTVTVRIPKDGRNVFMWHDNLWILRQLVFLLLSIVTHLLPSTSPLVDPASHALATHSALEQSVPLLRAAASEWWDRQRLEGEWARSDEAVQRVAEQLGRGFVEGQGEGTLRVKAKETAARIKASLLAQPAS